MSDEDERKAMEWLETWAFGTLGDGPNVKHACTLKVLLSRPVLPEVATPEAVDAMRNAWATANGDSTAIMRDTYRALYAHLTAPRTKEVEVDRWAVVDSSGAIWACDHKTEKSALEAVERMRGFDGHFTAVHLTGKATVRK